MHFSGLSSCFSCLLNAINFKLHFFPNLQTGGNLDDLLQDIELLSRDILNMQYENQKFHSQCDLNYDGSHPSLTEGMSKKPPYRSEMNLLLSFDGNTQKITSVPPAALPAVVSPTMPPCPPLQDLLQDLVQTQETPPPTLPQQMELLPPMLPYTDFQSIQTKSCPKSLQLLPPLPLPPPPPPLPPTPQNDSNQPMPQESTKSTVPDSSRAPAIPVLVTITFSPTFF